VHVLTPAEDGSVWLLALDGAAALQVREAVEVALVVDLPRARSHAARLALPGAVGRRPGARLLAVHVALFAWVTQSAVGVFCWQMLVID
jgi:hypothetical protein